MGIDEPMRYVALIVFKPITAAAASGPFWSDAPAGRQKGSQAAAHLGLQEAAGEAQGTRARDRSLLRMLHQTCR